MKKEQILNFMNTIPPDLIEEADIQAPARRRIPKPPRAGLIAACLCLVLLGTAFAANPEAVAALIDRLTVTITSTGDETSYTVDGGSMTKYPLSAFSPALLAASESRNTPVVELNFDTWDEVRAFLGEGIPCVWPASEDDSDRRFMVYLFHTEYDVLWGVDIIVDHTTDVVHSEIEILISTECWPGDNAHLVVGSPEGDFAHLESYPMANGSTAEIIRYTGPEKYPHANCKGYFMQDGILYRITAYATNLTAVDAVSSLHTILDSFPTK